MPDHKGRVVQKTRPAPKPTKRAAVPVRRKPKSNIISYPKDPSGIFARQGYDLIRTDEDEFLVLRSQKGKRRSKLAAEFSRGSLGQYVIKFHDQKLQKAFEKQMFVERLLNAGKK